MRDNEDQRVDGSRRTWLITTTVMGGIGGVAACVPFVGSFAPSEKAKAAAPYVPNGAERDAVVEADQHPWAQAAGQGLADRLVRGIRPPVAADRPGQLAPGRGQSFHSIHENANPPRPVTLG